MSNIETKPGIWFNSKDKKWDYLVLAPILAFPVLFVLIFIFVFGIILTTPEQTSEMPILFIPFMAFMFIGIFAISILGIITQIYAFINIFRSTKFTENEKVLWAVGVFFLAFIIVPVLQFIYFRKERIETKN